MASVRSLHLLVCLLLSPQLAEGDQMGEPLDKNVELAVKDDHEQGDATVELIQEQNNPENQIINLVPDEKNEKQVEGVSVDQNPFRSVGGVDHDYQRLFNNLKKSQNQMMVVDGEPPDQNKLGSMKDTYLSQRENGSVEQEDQDNQVTGMVFNIDGKDSKEYVEGHFLLPEDPNTITYCLWLNPFKWFVYNMVLSASNFQVNLNNGKIALANYNVYYMVFDAVVEIRVWSHVCTVIHAQGINLFLDAKEAKVATFNGFSQESIAYVPSGNITVVVSKSVAPYFYSGYIADLQMFPVGLTRQQVQDVRDGRLHSTKLVIDRVETNNSHQVLKSFSLDELVNSRTTYNVLLFREEATYVQAYDICLSYGGSLPDIRVHDDDEVFRICLGNYKDSPVDMWLLSPSFSENSDEKNCDMLSSQKNVHFKHVSWFCKDTSYMICCLVPRNTIVTLKGVNVGKESRFVIVQEHYTPKNQTLEGIGSLRVTWNESRIQIQRTGGEILYWKIPTKVHYLGRSTWLDSKGQQFNLSFSTCGPRDFTCSNGQCIPLEQRCNAIPGECEDFSDDDATCWQFRGHSEHYHPLRAPNDPRVNVNLQVIYVRHVDVNNNLIQVVMVVTLEWRDERLTFHNLRPTSSSYPNTFSYEDLQGLWHPIIYFPEGKFEENLDIETGINIRWSAQVIPETDGTPALVESYEALEYPGSDVILKIRQSMSISTFCPYNHLAFPFDVQLCTVSVKLKGYGPPLLAKDYLVVTGREQNLPVFRLVPVRCAYNESSMVVVALLLERRSEAFLLSVVGPCIVLGLLGHLSFLAFPLNQFNERTSTSLSLLIVVAALFSQTVSNLPATASPKAIDVWFFYFILRFFLFFVSHCLVELKRRRVSEFQNQDQTTEQELSSSDNISESSFVATLQEPNHSITQLPDSTSTDNEKRLRISYPQQTWMMETPQPQRVKSSPVITSQTVNWVSLFFNMLLDVVFFLAFYSYIDHKNSEVRSRFDEFNICDGQQ